MKPSRKAMLKDALDSFDKDVFEHDTKSILDKLLMARIKSGDIKFQYNGHNQIEPGEPVTLEETKMLEKVWQGDDVWIERTFIDTVSRYLSSCGTEESVALHNRILQQVDEEMGRPGHRDNELYTFIPGIKEAWINGEITVPIRLQTAGFNECHVCGCWLAISFDGQTFTMFSEEGKPNDNIPEGGVCKYPGGIKNYTVELDVPSGVMAVTNDWRGILPEGESVGNCDLNCQGGTMETTKDWARWGMFHPFVGNTCPSIIKTDTDQFTIGNRAYRGGTKENGWVDMDIEDNGIPGEEVTSVCTDLWWVSIADKDNILARMDADKYEEWDVDEIQVTPGRYAMTVNVDVIRDKCGEGIPEIFATIERIGDII